MRRLRRFRDFTRGHVQDLAALAALLFASMVLFKDAILRGWVYYEFDTTLYYYPVTVWVDKAIAQGRVPLWSPHIFGGFPLFADGETGALYPINLILLWLLNPAQAFIWLAVLRYFLAGAFMYAFIRVLRVRPIPALIAGLTFAFGSFTITQMQHVNVVSSAIWLPVILIFCELALRASGWRRVLHIAMGGVALGTQLLTIHIQPVQMSILMLVVYAAFRAGTIGKESGFGRQAVRAAVTVVGIGVVGLGLGAVQLAPLAELATQAVRGSAADYEFATAFAPIPLDLLTILFPYFFRISGYDYWTLWFRWETTVYVGIAPLVLAVIAIACTRRRESIFFTVIGAVSLLIALGDHTPLNLHWLLWQLPGFSLTRAPGRFSMLFVFSIAALAAIGTEYLIAGLNPAKKPVKGLNKLLIGGAVAGAVLFCGMVATRVWLSANETRALAWISGDYLTSHHQDNLRVSAQGIYDAVLNTLRWQNSRTILTFAFLLMSLAIVALWARRPDLRRWWQAALISLVAVDLLAFATVFHPQVLLDDLDRAGGTVQFLTQHRGIHRTYTAQPVGPTVPNKLLPFQVFGVGGYSSLDWKRHRDFLRLVRQGNSTLLDLWNVRYVVAPRSARAPGSAEKFRPVFEDKDIVIYENFSYLPRAFIVGDAEIVGSSETALQAMTQAGFNPRRQMVLEAQPDERLSLAALIERVKATEPAQSTQVRSRATIVKYGPTEITVKADAKQDAFLLLSDSFYPGWQAMLDGQPTSIYRGDYLFRAVFLPKGQHTVVFRFEPLSFTLGAWISLTMVLVVPFAVYGAYLRERRAVLQTSERRQPALEVGGTA